MIDEENRNDPAENEEEDQEEEDTEEEDEDEDSEESDSDEEDSDDSDDDEDADDNKPVTHKDLKKFGESIVKQLQKKPQDNGKNAERRISKKKGGKLPTNEDSSNTELANDVKALKLSEQKRVFGHKYGLAPEEVDYIFQLNPKPDKKFLESPFVKGGLSEMRRRANVANNTPRTGGRTYGSKNKSFSELKPHEKQENFRLHQESILASKGRR